MNVEDYGRFDKILLLPLPQLPSSDPSSHANRQFRESNRTALQYVRSSSIRRFGNGRLVR